MTQRGNGRARTFFGDSDYQLYLDLLTEHCAEAHAHLGLIAGDGVTAVAPVLARFPNLAARIAAESE